MPIMLELDNELFQKFADLIYKKTGISYDIDKKYHVEKRIEKRVVELGFENFREYYHYIKFSPDEDEFIVLINSLTVNETYFFRDFPQLQNFAEDVLPLYLEKKEKQGDNKIKIWSAACSTGEEPYTLSIILMEMIEDIHKWDIQIVASDINTEVLKSAEKGLYGNYSIRDVPEEYLKKYFTPVNNLYLVNLNVKKYVKFKNINLFDSSAVRSISGCDFIFCRNCLIYFDDESRKRVVENMYYSLNTGGFIFLGHSESIGRISSAFKPQKIGSYIVYSRP